MKTVKKTTATLPLSPHRLRQALAISDFDARPAHDAMAPSPRPRIRPAELAGTPRIGAVLLVLYEKNFQPHILLIRRSDDLKYHPGQISFPGGRHEDGEDLLGTALRETFEEVGLARDCLLVLGRLMPVYIAPSDFIVHPFVAWHDGQPVFSRQEREVTEIIEMPFSHFLSSCVLDREERVVSNTTLNVPYYRLGQHTIWGATAMILSELLQRLECLR